MRGSEQFGGALMGIYGSSSVSDPGEPSTIIRLRCPFGQIGVVFRTLIVSCRTRPTRVPLWRGEGVALVPSMARPADASGTVSDRPSRVTVPPPGREPSCPDAEPPPGLGAAQIETMGLFCNGPVERRLRAAGRSG